MNIVQVIPEFGLAGAEIMCENLTYELTKLGHKVVVISMYDYHSIITERLEESGVDVRYLNKQNGLDLSMIWKMKNIFCEVHAEVIHTHLYSTKYAIPAAIMAGVKHRVHTVHNIAEKETGSAARKINKFFYKYNNVVPVALSDVIHESILKEYRLNAENVPIIFNGIDLSKCHLKKDYDVSGRFKILHIGRFSEQKNHKGLLEAFSKFHNMHNDSELWLIGDGEKKAEMEAFVENKKLNDCVKFLGLKSNVYGYLQDADIFTLPSNYEGVPMTLIEAMGTGLPIVATSVGGVPDMLSNNENALVVKNDINLIVEAFERYYVNAELRKEHGMKALQRAEAFSSIMMAKKYFDIYCK